MSKPLRPNDRGALVSDLHRRLAAAGHRVDGVEEADGYFGPETTRSLLAFQTERGLDEHGLVDETTQAALVEAGFGHLPLRRVCGADTYTPLAGAAMFGLPSDNAVIGAALDLAQEP